MEQLKVLTRGSAPLSSVGLQHRDKLEQTKKLERELKDALRQKKSADKEKKAEARRAEVIVNRMEREFHPDSKRAARDVRDAERRALRKADGTVCEHGVWKCRVCNPVVKHK